MYEGLIKIILYNKTIHTLLKLIFMHFGNCINDAIQFKMN